MSERSSVIYGDSPFIEDMGTLTALCLLNDQVILVGTRSLDEELEDYWQKLGERGNDPAPTIVEQIVQTLMPESVISFYSRERAVQELWGSEGGSLEIPGIYVPNDRSSDLFVELDESEFNDVSRIFVGGITKGRGTVSDRYRDIVLIGASAGSRLPIARTQEQLSPIPTKTKVKEAANYLAQQTLQMLALPEIEAYHVDDILEARLKLSTDLEEFKAGMLELVWLLYERNGLSGDASAFERDCSVLIDTKIKAAVLSLELAISSHENRAIRRILRATGGVLLELGRTFLGVGTQPVLLGASAALLNLADSMGQPSPSVPIASFLYRVRSKKF